MSTPAIARKTVIELRADLERAEDAHTAAVSAAASGRQPWDHVRAAAGVVHQARAALKEAQDTA